MKRQLLAPENFDAEPVFAASPQRATDFEPDSSSGEDESEQLRLKMRELAACTEKLVEEAAQMEVALMDAKLTQLQQAESEEAMGSLLAAKDVELASLRTELSTAQRLQQEPEPGADSESMQRQIAAATARAVQAEALVTSQLIARERAEAELRSQIAEAEARAAQAEARASVDSTSVSPCHAEEGIAPSRTATRTASPLTLPEHDPGLVSPGSDGRRSPRQPAATNQLQRLLGDHNLSIARVHRSRPALIGSLLA